MLHNPRLQTRAHIHTRNVFACQALAPDGELVPGWSTVLPATRAHFDCVPVQKLITDTRQHVEHVRLVLSRFSWQEVCFPLLVCQPFPKSESHLEV